jgi:aspartate-semialdehyde dehydrogenase
VHPFSGFFLDRLQTKQNNMLLGIVGATGAVGVEILRSLEHRKVNVAELRLFASERSVGTSQLFNGNPVVVQGLDDEGECFRGLHIVLFAASKAVSQKLAPVAVKRGAVVIDNRFGVLGAMLTQI